MNERHEQLMAQAWIEFAPDAKAVTKRFAELIVRECIKAVKPDTEYPMESVDVVKEFHRGYWVGCNDSTMRIRDYFGVEE
jgi:hypothetical protein